MTTERKIEAAIEDHLRGEGWQLDTRGDHILTYSVGFENDEGEEEIEINVSKLARLVAAELVP